MPKPTTIGVLSPVTGGLYYGQMVVGMAREVDAVGGRIVVIQTLDAGLGSDEVIEAPEFAPAVAWDQLDGVVSIATATKNAYLEQLRAAGKAIALASSEAEGTEAPFAAPDNASGVTASVQHLLEHGHTRIGYAANLAQPDMRERFAAYAAAMNFHRLDPDPKWFFPACDNGEVGGRDVARQFVASGRPITALILATDRNAIGCMTELAELGVAVPDELAIVGFDGVDAGSYTEPTLSTVLQPFDEIGAAAARLVLAQLRGEHVAAIAHRSPSRFVARGSCGCADPVDSDAAGGLAFWRDEARLRFARSATRERSMREQYEIGMRLLDHARTDPRAMGWLRSTTARAACLALWDGDPLEGRVRVVGVHDPAGRLPPDLNGSVTPIEEFPPRSLVDMTRPGANEATILVPVKSRGLDFGWLAVAGEVDSLSENGREAHNQWAASLAAALEQQDLIESVRASEERYSLYAVATNDGLWDWDLVNDKVFYSGRCVELLGVGREAMNAGPEVWLDTVHRDDVERVQQVLELAISASRAVQFEHRIEMSDGNHHRLSCRALPVGGADGRVTRLIGSIHDIEPRKQLEEQLRQGALYDEVTGLPNRKLFLERLSALIDDRTDLSAS
ncbi:MAG TPA: substrate-binding domain-containing protein, partial [Ilumatobacteraceae bacterium]